MFYEVNEMIRDIKKRMSRKGVFPALEYQYNRKWAIVKQKPEDMSK